MFVFKIPSNSPAATLLLCLSQLYFTVNINHQLYFIVEINECETLPCYPFGNCTDKINDYSCSCNAGFTPGNTNKQCTSETQILPVFQFVTSDL